MHDRDCELPHISNKFLLLTLPVSSKQRNGMFHNVGQKCLLLHTNCYPCLSERPEVVTKAWSWSNLSLPGSLFWVVFPVLFWNMCNVRFEVSSVFSVITWFVSPAPCFPVYLYPAPAPCLLVFVYLVCRCFVCFFGGGFIGFLCVPCLLPLPLSAVYNFDLCYKLD